MKTLRQRQLGAFKGRKDKEAKSIHTLNMLELLLPLFVLSAACSKSECPTPRRRQQPVFFFTPSFLNLPISRSSTEFPKYYPSLVNHEWTLMLSI